MQPLLQGLLIIVKYDPETSLVLSGNQLLTSVVGPEHITPEDLEMLRVLGWVWTGRWCKNV